MGGTTTPWEPFEEWAGVASIFAGASIVVDIIIHLF
jgi:hypothetical protein